MGVLGVETWAGMTLVPIPFPALTGIVGCWFMLSRINRRLRRSSRDLQDVVLAQREQIDKLTRLLGSTAAKVTHQAMPVIEGAVSYLERWKIAEPMSPE